MDDQHASVKYLNEYRESSMMCFTETWLDETIDEQHLSVDGFGVPVRSDRTEASGKTKGGAYVYIIIIVVFSIATTHV